MLITSLIFLLLSNSITLRRDKSILYLSNLWIISSATATSLLVYAFSAVIAYFIADMFFWKTIYFHHLIILTLAASNFLFLLYNNPGKLYLYTGEHVGVFLAYFEHTLEKTISCSSFNNTFILLNLVVMIVMIINGLTLSYIEGGNRSNFLDIWNNKRHYLIYIWKNKRYLLILLLLIWSVIFIINAMLFMVGLGIVVDTTTTKLFLYTFLAKITSIRLILTIIVSSISKELRRENLSLSISTLLFMITLGWFNYLYIIPYIQMLAFPVLADLSLSYTKICLYVSDIKVSSCKLLMEYLNNLYKGFRSSLDHYRYYYNLFYQKTCINRASFIQIDHNKALLTKEAIPQFTPNRFNKNPITFLTKEQEVTYNYNGTGTNLTFLLKNYIQLFAANISNQILGSTSLRCKINLTLPEESCVIKIVIKNGYLDEINYDRTPVNVKNSYSHKDSSFGYKSKDNILKKLLDATDPTIKGSDLNVHMQSNTIYDNPNYNGESSREPLLQNTGTNWPRSASAIGDQTIEVKALDLKGYQLSLQFDLDKLSGFTKDRDMEWRNYLREILIELRTVFIQKWGVFPIFATTRDIYLNYDNNEKYVRTLCGALEKASGIHGNWINLFILRREFIEYLESYSEGCVYEQKDYTEDSKAVPIVDDSESESEFEHSLGIEADYTEDSEPVGEDTLDTTEPSNYNDYQEPLSRDEMECLLEELGARQLKAASRNCILGSLGISKAGRGRNIILDSNDRVHLLLTRLYNTKKDWFRLAVSRNSAYYDVANTNVSDLKINLEPYNYSDYQEPLSKDEMESLLKELIARQLNTVPRSCTLGGLGMSIAGKGTNIIVDSNDRVHLLLTRLYNTKKDWFRFVVRQNRSYYNVGGTSVSDLKINLEPYNYSDYQEPLSKDEMESLLKELRARDLNRVSSSSTLGGLGMSKAGKGTNIIVDSNDRVHLLLTRLYNTKKDWFKFVVRQNRGYDIRSTRVADLIIKLEAHNLS